MIFMIKIRTKNVLEGQIVHKQSKANNPIQNNEWGVMLPKRCLVTLSA